ncbi:MAG: hydrogenase maturation protease [Lentisphaerae bacterium]|nr:hydrogenase maturation protease [Lentisphaerota bacterium]
MPNESEKATVGKTLILALGNPILSDDAVGWEVADRLAPRLPAERYDVLKESGATLDLLRRLAGYDRLVVIDAIQLGNGPAGTVHRLTLEDLRSSVCHSSAHDINFATAFALAARFGYVVPADIRIYAVEVRELRRFAEGCTPEVAGKLDAIAEGILSDLRGEQST